MTNTKSKDADSVSSEKRSPQTDSQNPNTAGQSAADTTPSNSKKPKTERHSSITSGQADEASYQRGWLTFQIIASNILFFGTIAIVILLVSLRTSPNEIKDKRLAPLVECVSVEPYTEKIKINVSGIAVPFREVNIAAEVTGAITEKTAACKAGRYVEFGSHLLSIDTQKYQLAKDRLESELNEVNARKKRAEVELKGARDILELLSQDLQFQSTENETRERLFKQNAISETEVTNSRRALINAKNAEKTQRNRVATLEADVTAQESLVELKKLQQQEAVIDFDKAKITAPSNGVVISESVQKDDFVQAGTPLLVFEDTSAIEIKCDLRADQLQAVLDSVTGPISEENRFKLPPLTAKITYASNDEQFEWTGTLDRYDGLGLNESTRTAPIRIVVKKTKSNVGQRTLVRGMYVSVELTLGQSKGLLALPADTVRAGNVVWINNDKTLKKKRIKVLNRLTDKNKNEIVVAKAEDELQIGDSVILSPIPQAIDGMKLRIKGDPDDETPDEDSENPEGDSSVNNSVSDKAHADAGKAGSNPRNEMSNPGEPS